MTLIILFSEMSINDGFKSSLYASMNFMNLSLSDLLRASLGKSFGIYQLNLSSFCPMRYIL